MQAERQISLSCSPSLNAYAATSNYSHCSDDPTTTATPRRWREAEEQDRKDEDDDVAIANGGGAVFEFSFDCCAEAASSPISADQIFHNGKIKPTLPIYDHQQPGAEPGNRRKALRRLFIEERHSCPSLPLSSSSSDDESAAAAESSSELESVPSESYCVWKPKTASSSKEMKKAAGSSSKRWRLKDLLLARSSNERDNWNKKEMDEEEKKKKKKSASKKNEEALQPQLGRKMTFKEAGGEKRRSSYLPYRQELVGIFGNSGSGRNLHRF